MPYSFDLLDQEQQKKKDETEGTGQGAPAMTGGGETFSQGSGAAPAPQTSAPAAQKGASQQGSGFVNLDKYMTANQGNNFGGQFTGKVQSDVDQAKKTLDSSATGFTDASNQGTTRWNDVGDTAKGIVDNAGDKTSADDVAKLKGFQNVQYQGPESFSGSAYGTQAQGANTKANQEAGALQSEGGRFALLDQFFGRPNYNMGEKSLDNLLVQNGKGVAARSQSIGNQAKQLTSAADQTTQNLDNLATANRAATQDTAQQANDYLGNSISSFGDDLNKRYADYNTANNTYNTDLQSDVSDDQLGVDARAAYGLNPGDSLYDANLANYLNTTPAQASLGQFASDQDYARYLALSQLAGEDPTELTAADRAQAGTGSNFGRYTVDTGRLQSDLAAQKAQADLIRSGFDNSTGNAGLQAYQNALRSLSEDKKQAIANAYSSMGYPVPPGGLDSIVAAAGPKLSKTPQGQQALDSILGVSRKVG